MWLPDMFKKYNAVYNLEKWLSLWYRLTDRVNFPIVVTGTSNNPRNNVTLFYTWEGWLMDAVTKSVYISQ